MNSQTDYFRYLIEDQCKKLLNMPDRQIADVMGVSRPTLDRLRADPSVAKIGYIDRLENHLRFVKASILTTEERNDE